MGYPSDLTDAEWALIEHYFQPRDRRGSASLHPRKRIVDAILYVSEVRLPMAHATQRFPPGKRFTITSADGVNAVHGKPRWIN